MHFLLMLPECFFFLFETKENTRVGESHDVVVIAFKKLHTKTLSRRSQSLLACSRLSVSGGLKKRAGDDEWGLVGKERFLSPVPFFSIVLTDREPRTG